MLGPLPNMVGSGKAGNTFALEQLDEFLSTRTGVQRKGQRQQIPGVIIGSAWHHL